MDSTTQNIAATTAATATAATTPSNQGAAKVTTGQPRSEAPRGETARAPVPQSSDPQRDPRSLQFQVEGNRVVTTVVDENNKQVVVQIPDAEVIRIAKSIDRMQGFLVEGKA